MAVKPVGEYDPKKLEEAILAFWEDNGIMEATLGDEGERFSFLEGPPTANAPPALHHVEMRTFKDVVNRFQYMMGKAVPRKAGWDCHGLPVEVQVEKELGLASKKEIVEYGVDRFVEKCRESVFSHISEWDKLTKRMAYWIDLKSPYVTMDNDYIESVWWSLKTLWDKDMLYEGYKVVPMCSRCGTPLSSHEVALGYQTIKEETVIVALPAKGEDYSFLAWTTTPWTLLSNVALAVNPKVTYAKILYRGEKYVLAKDLAESRFPEADFIEELTGKDIIGKEYIPLFNHFIGKLEKPAWRVIEGDFVTTEDGTGIVHIAPAFGEDDYNVGQENGLPLINPVDMDGKFTDDIPELCGIFVKDADGKIIELLDERGSLVAKFPYEHEYPYCWRCNTPLLYYSMKSWFIRVGDHVDDLLEQNQKIGWYPPTIGTGRFGNWLENARDWGLSRNRFWGTPLPIWECADCDNKKAIGSREELKKEAATVVADDLDLHRPYVDGIKLKCDCGAQMTRVEYVIDCWYDSGAAPFAQYHYPFENEDLFKKSFPFDFISEATDQTRGWFYTLLVTSTLIFKQPAYLNCVVGGLLLDANGEKMSKSKKNIIDPWEMFESVGADAVRLQMCASAPWNAKRFGLDGMKEQVIPFLRTLWNCYSFTVRYMLLDGYDPSEAKGQAEKEVEDRWILQAADRTMGAVRDMYANHNYHHAQSALSAFIVEDLSRWYIKLIRDRLWLEDLDGGMNPKKRAAYETLVEVFEKACMMLAPMAPFMTEEIYRNISPSDEQSVHLLRWPKSQSEDGDLIAGMDIVRSIFEAGSRARQDAKIKLRYPIAKVTVTGNEAVSAATSDLASIIKKQLNSKEVEFVEEVSDMTYSASPAFSVIGPKHGKKAGEVAKAIKDDPETAQAIKESGKAQKMGGFSISPDMIADIKFEVPADYAAAPFRSEAGAGIVLIDVKRDESLVLESLARDFIRHIQEMRKKMDLEELARIQVKVTATPRMEAMLGQFMDMVTEETRSDAIDISEGFESPQSLKFEGEKICYEVNP